MKIGYDYTVGPCRALLRFVGAWPDPVVPENAFAVLRFFVAASTIIFFACFAQTVMMVKVWGDLNLVIEILTTANIPCFIAAVKLIVTWLNRKTLRKLVILMSEDWHKPFSPENVEVMWANARFSRRLSLVLIGLAEGTVAAQFVMIVVFNVNDKGEEGRAMFMTSWFPYDTQTSPNYEITWVGQLFSNIYGATSFSAVDTFFAVLMLHLCVQLAILRKILMRLTYDPEIESNAERFGVELARLVNRHDHLNEFAGVIEDTFNKMFLAQMMTSSVALCLQGYQLIMISTASEDGMSVSELIHMMYYTSCFSFSLFIYCYVAERLQYESTEISYAAYQTDWYNWNPKNTKMLLLLMHKSRKPLEITAGKFCAFSLMLFCSILKTSGGYLSMLLAVKDRVVVTD